MTEHETIQPELGSAKLVAGIIDKSVPSVWRLTKNDPEFPKPIKVGGSTRWIIPEIFAYIASKAALRHEAEERPYAPLRVPRRSRRL